MHMKTENKKNDTFLYIGTFFIMTASLSIGVLLMMIL